jgi:hypothetical protein
MKLSDIIDYILLETGNYLVSDLVKSEINLNKFLILTKSVLGEYTNYRPRRDSSTIYVESQQYIFPQESSPITIDKISNRFITLNNLYQEPNLEPNLLPNRIRDTEHIPALPTWKYNRPKLYINYVGLLYVMGNYDYTIRNIYNSEMAIIDYDLVEITYSNTEFLNLLAAKFLMTVGKQRRAFTANDLPITTDASDLVSEGKDLWDSTMETLRQNSTWWTII